LTLGLFNFSKSDKNQVATLILLKFNIIFYDEKKNSDQSVDVKRSRQVFKVCPLKVNRIHLKIYIVQFLAENNQRRQGICSVTTV
jgi:hypothetical protein